MVRFSPPPFSFYRCSWTFSHFFCCGPGPFSSFVGCLGVTENIFLPSAHFPLFLILPAGASPYHAPRGIGACRFFLVFFRLSETSPSTGSSNSGFVSRLKIFSLSLLVSFFFLIPRLVPAPSTISTLFELAPLLIFHVSGTFFYAGFSLRDVLGILPLMILSVVLRRPPPALFRQLF